MKLEEGMYVRTKHNGICKLYREFYEDSVDVGIGVFSEIDGFFIDEDEINYIEKRDIIKASHSIIDLIQDGDYVNGSKLLSIDYAEDRDGNCDKLHFYYSFEDSDNDVNEYYEKLDIKSIVTKEQFESMSYKL